MSALRLCSACRHRVLPVRPQPFAPRAGRSAGATDTVNKYLEDELGKRKIEEQRVAESGFPFVSEPRYHPWCSKLTISKQEAADLRKELLAGNDARARQEELAERIVIDYANGVVLPVYAMCARANRNGDCAVFQPGSGGTP